uniref:Uncharacterized protein n=1 Tax=Acrobeloides nanus TaxID=290746 RepID=A0A914EFN2_9BILA
MAKNDPIEFKVYNRRWYMLIVVCLVNFSNAMTWITFAPISSYTKQYYGNSNAPMIFNIVFMGLSIPVGFIAMWSVDKFGLRTGCLLGAWINLVGNILRVIGSGDFFSSDWRFPICLAGQCIAACAQPFIMYLPTKLAAFWFPDSQRALANTLASMSNPLGIALQYALSPQFVNDSHPTALLFLTSLVAVGAVITALLSIGVTSSKPPTPASASSESDVKPPAFFAGFKRCLSSKTFLVLAFSLGGGVGLFNALYNNLQPALCVKGYSNTFSGIMGALLIVSGLVGAAVSGVYVDKTHRFEETMKVSFCLAGFAACGLSISINYENVEWAIATSIFVFGVFGFAIYPIGLEMGVEATYPVAEATSSGLIIMLGQVEGVIYVLVTSFLTQSATAHEKNIQTCNKAGSSDTDIQDWKYSFIAWNCFVVIGIMVFTAAFWPKYKRVQYEQGRLQMAQKLNSKPKIEAPQNAPNEEKDVENHHNQSISN